MRPITVRSPVHTTIPRAVPGKTEGQVLKNIHFNTAGEKIENEKINK